MLTDTDILKYFCGAKLKNIQKKKLENIPEDILNYLNNRYDDSLSIRETILRIKLHIDKHPLCPYCGKPVLIHEYKSYFYPTCGSKECIHLEFNKNFKNTMKKRYGYEYNFLNKEILDKSVKLAHTPENIQKSIETSKQIYGDGNCRNNIKANKTKIERYGTINYNNSEKCKQTKIERYGDPGYNNSKKIHQTKLEKYGDPNYTNPEKIKQTCLEKYGVDHISKSKEFQNKAHDILRERYKSAWNLNKCKETWIEKYGVDNPWKAESVKEKIKETFLEKYGNIRWTASEEGRKKISEIGLDKNIQLKKYNTAKKNNSFNKSKVEEECYILLKEKYPDIIRQYRSDLYPYNCDFYIPSLDLYIEFNGSDLHGFHSFDETNKDDILRLNDLKERSKKLKEQDKRVKNRYDYSIYTWIDLDIRKRNTVKENNLNFIEFWNINEVKEWLQNNN